MLDETKNIYAEKDIIVRLTPDEMTIMKLLIEKLETNSYLPRSEIELKINRIKKDMFNKIIRKLRDKLKRTSIKISCTRGLGYYIEKKEEIKMPIYTPEELNAIDNAIMNDFDNLVNKAMEHIYKDRECIALQKIIKKQQDEIEKLKKLK